MEMEEGGKGWEGYGSKALETIPPPSEIQGKRGGAKAMSSPQAAGHAETSPQKAEKRCKVSLAEAAVEKPAAG